MAKNHFSFEYYHGCESEQFAFYRIPKVLFTDPPSVHNFYIRAGNGAVGMW